MMSTRIAHLLVIGSLWFWSCSQPEVENPPKSVDHATLYQELLGIEHGLWTKDYDQAKNHSKNLDMILKNGYNLFCPEESAHIDGARMINAILVQDIGNKNYEKLMDDLRILKASIINMETDDDYDPYFAFLWRFEEEMYATTKVAIDPMLDLYEWNEFEDMVACMNQTWEPIRMHTPSPEILDNDPAKYKNQTVYKIYLENAMKTFNTAVTTNDYENYPLCESAEAVRNAYIDYINTFIQYSTGTEFFMAKI